ncbi:MAG: hypothetical protein J7M18_05800 [Candidatus Eremiobacteraeota bacterium]|nr:hypothetical protein [Candidatus Eremiobacteraeota bacterium]
MKSTCSRNIIKPLVTGIISGILVFATLGLLLAGGVWFPAIVSIIIVLVMLFLFKKNMGQNFLPVFLGGLLIGGILAMLSWSALIIYISKDFNLF